MDSRKASAAVAVIILLALPLAAEEPPAEPERHPRIVAAGWCTLTEGRPAEEPADPETEEEPPPAEDRIGCDAGIGAELAGKSWRQGRLSAVAVGGSKSVGVGASWSWREWGRPVAVAVGVVVPWDSQGIYVEGAALAVGATVGLFGSGRAAP